MSLRVAQKSNLCNNATFVLYMCMDMDMYYFYDVACDISVLEFLSFYILHVVWCLTKLVLLQPAAPHLSPVVPLYGSVAAKKRQCRTQLSEQTCCA